MQISFARPGKHSTRRLLLGRFLLCTFLTTTLILLAGQHARANTGDDWEHSFRYQTFTLQVAGTLCSGNRSEHQGQSVLEVNGVPFSAYHEDGYAWWYPECSIYAPDDSLPYFVVACFNGHDDIEMKEHAYKVFPHAIAYKTGTNELRASVGPPEQNRECRRYYYRMFDRNFSASTEMFGHEQTTGDLVQIIENLNHSWDIGADPLSAACSLTDVRCPGHVSPILDSENFTSGSVSTQRTLHRSLRDLNPELAETLDNLVSTINANIDAAERRQDDIDTLRENADWPTIDCLVSLRQGVIQLLQSTTFADVDPGDLRQILDASDACLTPSLEAEVLDYFDTLRQEIEAAQAELARLIEETRAQFAALSDVLADVFDQYGVDDENYGTYESVVVSDNLPAVTLPNPENSDPNAYGQQANYIIGLLQQTIQGNRVVLRGEFLDVWALWLNWYDESLAYLTCRGQYQSRDCAPLSSGEAQARYTALYAANQQVQNFAGLYINTQTGYFRDLDRLPSELPGAIDDIKPLFPEEAKTLRRQVNVQADGLRGHSPNSDGISSLDMHYGMIVMMGMLSKILHEDMEQNPIHPNIENRMELYETIQETLGVFVGAGRAGVGFIPLAGDALDLCEAATGYEWCMPNAGRKLSTSERAFAVLGLVAGSSFVWSKVGGLLADVTRPITSPVLQGEEAAFNKAHTILLASLGSQSRRQALQNLYSQMWRGPANDFSLTTAQRADDAAKGILKTDGTYETVPTVNLWDDVFNPNTGRLRFKREHQNLWSKPTDDVDEWTYVITRENGEPRVFFAPKSEVKSPGQLLPNGTSPQNARVAATGTLNTGSQGQWKPKILWASNETEALDGAGSFDWHDNYVHAALRKDKPSDDFLAIGTYTRGQLAALALKNEQATFNLFRGHWLSDTQASAYGLRRGWNVLDASARSHGLFEAQAGLELIDDGHRMITAGDDALRNALGTSGGKSIDLLTRSPSGDLALTEVKRGANANESFSSAVLKFDQVYNALSVNGNADDIGALNIYLHPDAIVDMQQSSGDYIVQNGYLFDTVAGQPHKVGAGQHKIRVITRNESSELPY